MGRLDRRWRKKAPWHILLDKTYAGQGNPAAWLHKRKRRKAVFANQRSALTGYQQTLSPTHRGQHILVQRYFTRHFAQCQVYFRKKNGNLTQARRRVAVGTSGLRTVLICYASKNRPTNRYDPLCVRRAGGGTSGLRIVLIVMRAETA